MNIERVLRRALVSGSVASATSGVALAAMSLAERGSAPQALNATSHWLHGDRAARVRRLDVAHTGTGYATHLAATIFWAALYEAWQEARPAADLPSRASRGALVAALAAVVDYTITPKRFTPGCELVITRRAMAAVYAAMAAGFAIALHAPSPPTYKRATRCGLRQL